MPLWKIAWRSIQRRSVASFLTMFSMALGVMLVVAVLLIVGVVDESFRSNSSLGYDSIVGAKGGEMQLTLNTIFYLSKPVENLPFEFYRQFLPAKERTDLRASAGVDYETRIEFWNDSARTWSTAANSVSIPAGQRSVRMRVPLLPTKREGPRDFTIRAEITSKNTVNKSALAVAVIQPGKRRVDPQVSPVDIETETLTPANEDEPTTTEPEETVRLVDVRLEIKSYPAVAADPFAYFEASLKRPSETEVQFTTQLSDGADGRYWEYLAETETSAIPVCLGDYYQHFRVVGTTPSFFNLVYDRQNERTYQFASGKNFTDNAEGFGVFEAILGAKVAREVGKEVGDTIQPSHGAPDGEAHQEFLVVGVLEPNGTPQDRAVFVNMKGFNLIPDHIREDGKKEVTSLLVDTKHPFQAQQLRQKLVDEPVGQLVKPVEIIFSLFNSIVGPIRNLLLVLTALICVVSGISILVSIYNSMNDRKQEIAVMRSLGAGRGTVMAVVLLESVIISMAGGFVGWLAGHGLIGLASQKIENDTGVVVSAFQLAPPMEELSYLLGPALTPTISVEIWLVPILILLAVIVGFMPALSAYRTDVAKALQSSP